MTAAEPAVYRTARRSRRQRRRRRPAGSIPASSPSTVAAIRHARCGLGRRSKPTCGAACTACCWPTTNGARGCCMPATSVSAHAGALRILMFGELNRLSRNEVDAWLQRRDGDQPQPSPAGLRRFAASVDHAQFTQAIARIHEAIRAGETYQVNYTYRLPAQRLRLAAGAVSPAARGASRCSYGALIALPPGDDAGATATCCRARRNCSCAMPAAADRAADEGHGDRAIASAAEGDSETARHLSFDIEEPGRKPDDRRPAAQRPRPAGRDRLGDACRSCSTSSRTGRCSR